MRRATPRRRTRTEYRTDAPPKDGSIITVLMPMRLATFWDQELRQWVLVRPLNMDTLSLPDIVRWRRPRGPS
jgi:hypothetical protein